MRRLRFMSEHWLRERAVVRDHLVACRSGNDLAFACRVSETRQALLNGAARGPAFDHPPWESAFAECDGVPDLLHVRDGNWSHTNGRAGSGKSGFPNVICRQRR